MWSSVEGPSKRESAASNRWPTLLRFSDSPILRDFRLLTAYVDRLGKSFRSRLTMTYGSWRTSKATWRQLLLETQVISPHALRLRSALSRRIPSIARDGLFGLEAASRTIRHTGVGEIVFGAHPCVPSIRLLLGTSCLHIQTFLSAVQTFDCEFSQS